MKVIHNKEELMAFVDDADCPYDVDAHWQIDEVDYSYPIILEFTGMTQLGSAYKSRSIEEFRSVFREIKEVLGE